MGSGDVGGRGILFPRRGAAGRVNSALEFHSQPFMVKKWGSPWTLQIHVPAEIQAVRELPAGSRSLGCAEHGICKNLGSSGLLEAPMRAEVMVLSEDSSSWLCLVFPMK